MKSLSTARAIATVFGLGYLRPASGTWASAAAIVLALMIDRYMGFPALVFSTVLVSAVGYYAIDRALLGDQTADPSEFVIDEVAGQWLALLASSAAFWARGHEGFLPYPAPLAAFVFFRLFDIWKPWIIGRADRMGGARGIMLDDLLAGAFAGMATIIAAALYHIVLFS
jgi:phosphatidylglycerophosphatase A